MRPRRDKALDDSSGAARRTARPAARKVGTPKRRKSRWRFVRRGLVLLLILALIPVGLFAYEYRKAEVPTPTELRNTQIATILAGDGTTVLSRVAPPEGNRVNVPLDAVPQHVRDAVLAAEDRSFYSNPGFSVTGFVRAARDNLTGAENAGGGSTITQQYVKNTVVGQERSIERKWRELVLSAKMARQWSKDDVFAAYLNTIYFGRGAYGIATAAQAYFGKPLADLTVAEGAVLAAVVRSPSNMEPLQDTAAVQERWNYVLDGMVSLGTLSPLERAAIEFPTAIPLDQVPDPNAARGPEGLIRAQVLRELEAAGISQDVLDTRGLQITTTIDPKAQQAAVDSVRSVFEGEPGNLRSAVVSIDPRTGAVRAYYGGEQGQGYDFAQAPLQTGSSFKVFGLIAALKEGIPLSARYNSGPLWIGNLNITNVEGASCGNCNIAEALKRSLNTSFYRLTLSMADGAQKIADAAHEAGIPEQIPGLDVPTLTQEGGPPETGIVLGQYQVRPIDMASSFATLAASGTFHEPYFVQKVVAADGEVLLDRGTPEGEQRIDKAIAENVSQAMLPIAAWSRNHNLAGGRASASKTGTTQLGDTGMNKDAWMVGYTPSLSTAVWVGTEQGEPLVDLYGSSVFGSGLPSDIWKKTMDTSLAGTANETFPFPDPVGGQAGVPVYVEPTYTPPRPQQRYVPPAAPQIQLPPIQLPPQIQIPSQIEILPGIVIQIPGR